MVAFFASRSWQDREGCCVHGKQSHFYHGVIFSLLLAVTFAMLRDCAGFFAFVLGNRAVPRCYHNKIGIGS